MASLERNLRRDLENAVKKARRVAEAGARQVLEQLAVGHHEPWATLTAEQRKLRNRLRAHGRQLGDRLDEKQGTQSIDKLAGECAYEHWHRLLFARFLGENGLLVEPDSGMALSLDECRELARERGVDWLESASEFAQRMLPQIFRIGDPVLDVKLPPEKRQQLETILETLPLEVFVADDSLGWVYQYWQAEEKATINNSENKIGSDELPAVTQLFTEDYMVLFLLHNTLGAWWAGKVFETRPELARDATSEDELRKALALPGVDWEYLRLVKRGDLWNPAAGLFESWPREARTITLLDPCMGSGHFLVYSLQILAALRMSEERLSKEDAIDAVLRDNLFGLEVDPRCTQIAAFNLAFAAWRALGYRTLPSLNLACSGQSPAARKEEWLRLGETDHRIRNGLERLYELFERAPELGSLINPREARGTLLDAGFEQVQPFLARALALESNDDAARELAVTAWGIARAANLLAREFTLVVTNVPYLVKGKQIPFLQQYTKAYCPEGAQDLATVFLKRCEEFTVRGGTHATVTPQNWLFLKGYSRFRTSLIAEQQVHMVAKVGSGANATASWDVLRALAIVSHERLSRDWSVSGIEVTEPNEDGRARELVSNPVRTISRSRLKAVPDTRFAFSEQNDSPLLAMIAWSPNGSHGADSLRHRMYFWEFHRITSDWRPFQTTVSETMHYGGREELFSWFNDGRDHRENPSARLQGEDVLGKCGVAVSMMRELAVTLYTGELFDISCTPIVPHSADDLPAIWCFCSSPEFNRAVRAIDQKLNVTNATLVKIPFDLIYWRNAALQKYPNGLPKQHSDDPTQWLFDGHPAHAIRPLHVATARLLGYCWPRQTGSTFSDCTTVAPDELDSIADEDGIVCLAPLKGEPAASDRIRVLLAEAYGSTWSAAKLNELLLDAGFGGESLDNWLRDEFFEKHCVLFHHRPFVWQIWDGLHNGFSALVNYHKLAAANGEGRRTLEKLIYTYLGDWIDRQRADQKAGVEGADSRVAGAEHLKSELENILKGEPPYDIFVRWKTLHEQPIGWEPDINDGVRINIRPFMAAKPLNARGKNVSILRVSPRIKWEKDRGTEPNRPKADYPWFYGWDGQSKDFLGGPEFDGNRWNDLHYSNKVKRHARTNRNGDKR